MRPGLGLLFLVSLLAVAACGTSAAVTSAAGTPASFGSITSALQTALSQESMDVSNEITEGNRGPGDSAGPCANLQANVDYDVKTNVDHDAQNVSYDISNLQSAIAAIRQDIADMKNDVNAFANEGVTGPSGESATIASMDNVINQAIATANGDIDQSNNLVADAYAEANSIATGKCSGDGAGSPPGKLGHIS